MQSAIENRKFIAAYAERKIERKTESRKERKTESRKERKNKWKKERERTICMIEDAETLDEKSAINYSFENGENEQE